MSILYFEGAILGKQEIFKMLFLHNDENKCFNSISVLLYLWIYIKQNEYIITSYLM